MGKEKRQRRTKEKSVALEKAKEVVSTLVGFLGVDAQAKIHSGTDEKTGKEIVKIEIVGGDELGRLIGRQGNSLASLQLILSILVNKQLEKPAYVVLDVNGYRAKREESLGVMARERAEIAKNEERVYEMPPMNSADRRIIHMALSEDSEAETESVGFGAGRRVLIKPPGLEIDASDYAKRESVDEEELEEYVA